MENTVKRNGVLVDGIGSSRSGEKMCRMIHGMGSQKGKGQIQIWRDF
jgi:hypothetical protein